MSSKVALCLYGFYNNRADQNAGDKGYAYIQEKIIKYCESRGYKVDVFFHCWETGLKDKLVKLYKPKNYQFESSHNFGDLGKQHGIEEDKINEGFSREGTIYQQCTVNASLSFFYSRSRALEISNEDDYDIVISSRFDLGQRSTWHKGYNVSLMEFDTNLNMDYIYSAMWRQLNAGMADQWFFSNQENMVELSKMYDMALKDYFQNGSDYEKAITEGWVDSNNADQFSNEVLKNKELRSKDLVKYPKWQMINNHIMHKWHFINTGLYDKSRYIGNVKV